MKIINKDTGVMLEAAEDVARGFLQNPIYTVVNEPETKPAMKKPRKRKADAEC